MYICIYGCMLHVACRIAPCCACPLGCTVGLWPALLVVMLLHVASFTCIGVHLGSSPCSVYCSKWFACGDHLVLFHCCFWHGVVCFHAWCCVARFLVYCVSQYIYGVWLRLLGWALCVSHSLEVASYFLNLVTFPRFCLCTSAQCPLVTGGSFPPCCTTYTVGLECPYFLKCAMPTCLMFRCVVLSVSLIFAI